jgi:hypothetical protein
MKWQFRIQKITQSYALVVLFFLGDSAVAQERVVVTGKCTGCEQESSSNELSGRWSDRQIDPMVSVSMDADRGGDGLNFKSPAEVKEWLKKDKAARCEASKAEEKRLAEMVYQSDLAYCTQKANSSFGISIGPLGGVTVPAWSLQKNIYEDCKKGAKAVYDAKVNNAGSNDASCKP